MRQKVLLRWRVRMAHPTVKRLVLLRAHGAAYEYNVFKNYTIITLLFR